MPAVYAHHRFGKLVFEKLDGELKEIIKKYYAQFVIGLQGPDTLLYHRPYLPDEITEIGDLIHKEPFSKFLKKAIHVVRKEGIDSGEYAYLLGFICHFTLDSEVHPYVDEYAYKNDVTHVFMETEFDKYVLSKEGLDPFKTDILLCISHDSYSAKCMSSFFDCLDKNKALIVLNEMYFERKLLYTPTNLKYNALDTIFKLHSSFKGFKEMVMQKEDHPKCAESNLYLYKKLFESVDLCVELMHALDDSIQNGTILKPRFDRDFETLK